jgi:hypothetical protein
LNQQVLHQLSDAGGRHQAADEPETDANRDTRAYEHPHLPPLSAERDADADRRACRAPDQNRV